MNVYIVTTVNEDDPEPVVVGVFSDASKAREVARGIDEAYMSNITRVEGACVDDTRFFEQLMDDFNCAQSYDEEELA